MIQTNFLAVLVAAIAATAVGVLWYGPLFGKEWSKLIGFTPEKMVEAKKNGTTTAYVVNFIAAVVMAYVLSNSLADRHIVDIGTALYLAFWIWLGFIATVMIAGVLWEKKPMALYWIQSLYYLVSLWVMAIVLIWLR